MTPDPATTIAELKAEIADLQHKLDLSQAAFLNIVGKTTEGILIYNQAGIIVYANPAATAIFGQNLGDLLGEDLGIFVDTNKTSEIIIVHKERGPLTVEVNIADTTWNKQAAKLVNIHDVSEHKKTEKKLSDLSHFDALTNLSNRVYFEDQLKKSISHSRRTNKMLALLYLDLDGFKQVNDQYGHQVGDTLLMQVGSLFKSNTRAEDTISRIGGDEFAIILENVDGIVGAERVAQKLLKQIKESIKIDAHEVHVGLSIGIALFPTHGSTPEELIKKADAAMYRAKNAGRGQYQVSV